MKKYWVALPILFLGTIYGFYAAAYYAWLTATPLSEGRLVLLQRYFYIWLFASICMLIAGVSCVVRIIVLHRKSRKFRTNGSTGSPINPAPGEP